MQDPEEATSEYKVYFTCQNCGHNITAAIKKGLTVHKAVRNAPPCPNCRCYGVLQQRHLTTLAIDPASAALQPAESRGQSLEQSNNPGTKSPGN